MAFIASLNPRPDIIVLQEVRSSRQSEYKAALEQSTQEPWFEQFALNCAQANMEGMCASFSFTGAYVLTRFPKDNSEAQTFMYPDEHLDGRGVARMTIDVNGTHVTVFSVHLPADGVSQADVSRQDMVTALKGWAAGFASPRLMGGDFNDDPTAPSLAPPNGMTGSSNGAYDDAWVVAPGSGSGDTIGGRRLDYWFSDNGGSASAISASTLDGPFSDHRAVLVAYAIGSGSAAHEVPGIVQMEDFDAGGAGSAYNDTTIGNEGNAYRSEDVDIEATADVGGGYNVGWITEQEWIEYTVNVTRTGTYDLLFRVAAESLGGEFHIEVDGVDVTGSIQVPSTGGWQNWLTIVGSDISLNAGIHGLRFVADTQSPTLNGIGNFNYFEIRAAPHTAPGIVQAEDFDTGGEGFAYHDLTSGNSGGEYRSNEHVDIEATTDVGGGYNVGWIKASEWMNYTVNVTTTGMYDFFFRVAAESQGGEFHIEVDGVNVTGSISIPSTGGWQDWQTITRSSIQLNAGIRVVRFMADAESPTLNGIGNLNYFEIRPATETVLLSDDFDDNSFNTTEWIESMFSGTTDPTVGVAEASQRLEIGPLPVNSSDGNSHYNGARSVRSFDFTGASVYVELAQPSTDSGVFAMLTIGDSSNYYRFSQSGGTLELKKKIAGSKSPLTSVSYSQSSHAFLRIQHVDDPTGNDKVRFYAAPKVGNEPGTWTLLWEDSWASSVPVSALQFELKAGLDTAVSSAVTVAFDNFKAVKQN